MSNRATPGWGPSKEFVEVAVLSAGLELAKRNLRRRMRRRGDFCTAYREGHLTGPETHVNPCFYEVEWGVLEPEECCDWCQQKMRRVDALKRLARRKGNTKRKLIRLFERDRTAQTRDA